MDDKGFILEYKDFNPSDKVEMDKFIWKQIVNIEATKIHIRKW